MSVIQPVYLERDRHNTRPDTPEQLLADVRALLPAIAADAAATEQRRRPNDALMQALADTGLYRFFVPRRYGGLEYPLDLFVDIGLALATACTSTAWATTFCMEHNWMLGQFPEPAQDAIFGATPWVIAPGTIAATGGAQREGEGYRLRGRWSWGTGVMHSDWALLSGIIEDTRELRLFAVPMHEVQIVDVWQMDGMAGTGSNDMVVDGAWVDERFSQPVGAMTIGRGAGAALHGSPMFRMPMMPILFLAAGVPAIGAARAALDRFVARAPTRMKFGSRQPQSESVATQVRIGEVRARIDTAELIARQVAAETERWGRSDEVCPLPERARTRLLMNQAVRLARDAVRELFEASGANAHRLDEPLQRIHRDVHTIAAHAVFDMDVIAEQVGRLELGLTATMPL